MNDSNLAIAIDVGGTKITAALVNRDFQILDQENVRIEQGIFSEVLLKAVDSLLDRNINNFSKIACLGIGLPEYVHEGEAQSNLVISWNYETKLQLQSLVFAKTGSTIPFSVEADVRCGAIGEYSAREEAIKSSILYISWGTGLSTTILLSNGNCLAGARGEAIAFGEWQVCQPGDLAISLENYSSGKGMATQFKALTRRDLTAIEISEVAEGGDVEAQEFLQRVGSVLASEISKFAQVLDPDEIILGGGIGTSNSFVKREVLRSYTQIENDRARPAIISARLSDRSGVIGAAIFAFRLLGSQA